MITAALAALISCSRDNANHLKGEQAVAVTVTAVSMKNAVFYNRYPGNMVALKEVELRGQVSGYVTGIYFDEGKRVRKGDKLYEIDRRKYEAAYNGAQAVMKIAEDNLEKAQRDADRYTDLAGREAIARLEARPMPVSSIPPHHTGSPAGWQRLWISTAWLSPPTRPGLMLMIRQASISMA